ncbi:MAG: heme-binding protein [Mycobacteriaceae bacterium]|nr:heme-binding protein [Mycobacteriaceae bacterium]
MLGATALLVPSASAEPDDCSASGLAATISSVTKSTADYLAAHPDANQALLDITKQPPSAAIGMFDGYFKDHPQQADELRVIQQPAIEYQNRCGMQVEPSQAFMVLQEV